MTAPPGLLALHGAIRRYAWGSRTAIPQMLGLPPTGEPAAELWLGAHPDDPAFAPEHGATLDRLIAADPAGWLGRVVADRFGGLPFLLKVLAADRALSIQVHPDLDQARAGYAAEEARGVPRSSPERNYKDPNHKPELLCALTEFDALCGFRPVARTLALLDALDVAELAPYRALLAGPDGPRAAFTALLTLDDPKPLVDAVVAGARRLDGGPFADAARATLVAAGDFPGDVGAVLALLLNAVRLRPGEAIFLGAGNVHAYLRGVGVEIMANSDNVLRCGLTPKHVDVSELLRVTDFTELADPVWPGVEGTFAAPVPDFALSVFDLTGPVGVGDAGPVIVLCTDGDARVEAFGSAVDLTPGFAAFVPAREAAFTLRGSGRAFVATVGAET